jgi:transmembrane sensor
MKEKDLFKMWLNHELEKEALEAFEQSDAFNGFKKLHKAAQHFKTPAFNVVNNYDSISTALDKKKQKPIAIFRIVSGLAAVFIALFGLFYFFNTPSTSTYVAENGERKEVVLPDTSKVILNAASSISFDENSWDNSRELILDGEAYFKVAKGKIFRVTTSQGTVTVLGTQFIVKNRPDFFEVVCYEGAVKVNVKNETYKLTLGNSIRIQNNEIKKSNILAKQPSWLGSKSIFSDIPLANVLNEMERQYNITFINTSIDTSVRYSGNFTHNNLNTALQSITIPLNLEFEINGRKVLLKNN